jgi:hypothetical protein
MANPVLTFFTSAGATISALAFGNVASGQESDVVEVHLFNNRNGTTSVDTARNVAVAVRNDTVPTGTDPVTEGWVRARSDGVINLSNIANVFDDEQNDFTTINEFTNLEIGDIPSNVGRKLFLKLAPPPTAEQQANAAFRIIAGAAPPSSALPFFFNRAFGDGIVEDKVPQIFPPVLSNKEGFWTDLVAVSSGRYTGDRAQQFVVAITGTAVTIGIAQYRTSNDSGATFGTAITTSTTAPTNVPTSADEDLGVRIRFTSALGGTFGINDEWTIDVDIEPFAMKAGATDSLAGFVGFGEALVANNRIRHSNPTQISGLTVNAKNFIFLEADGTFTNTTDGNPQQGKLKLGHFETNSNRVISAVQFALPVTLGTDAFDDFGPNLQELEGLTWTFFRGKFRRFNEVFRIPGITAFPCGTISLFPGATNYIQINPFDDPEPSVVVLTSGYSFDNLPLFRVTTGSTFMEDIIDDRTNIGVTSLERSLVTTISDVTAGVSFSFTSTDFAARAVVKKTVFTPDPAVTGYTVTIFGKSDLSTDSKQYQAGTLSGVFTDDFTWFFTNTDSPETRTLYGVIENLNAGGLTIDLGISLDYEQLH